MGFFFFTFFVLHGGVGKSGSENTEHLVEPLARRGLQFLLGGLLGKSKKQKQNNLLLSTKQEVRGAVLSLFSKWSLIFHNSVCHLCLCASLRMQRTPQAHIQSNSQLRVKLRGPVTLSGVCLQHAGFSMLASVCSMLDITPDEYWSPRRLQCGQEGSGLPPCRQLHRFPPHYPPIFSRCELILHIPSRPRPRSLPCDSWL